MCIYCTECGSSMYLDDTDFNFKGCYDRYYNCPNCKTSCIEETRFSYPYRQLWHSENNDDVRDWVVSMR